MSVISEKCRTALYAKLNVSGVTSLCNGVFDSKAPDNVSLPYVILNRQAPAPVVYALGTQVLEDDLWLIKAVTDEDSDPAKSPQKLAEDILAACRTALGTTLTVSGNTVTYFQRFSDIPGYQERLNDRDIYHRGFLQRIAVT